MINVGNIVRKLFKEKKWCDIVFVVGEGENVKEIPAHTLSLGDTPFDFCRMLRRLKTKGERNPQGQLIKCYPKLCPDLFELMIYDAYGIPWDEEREKELFKDFDGVMKALNVASILNGKRFWKRCENALCELLTISDSMRFLSIGLKHSMSKVKLLVEVHAAYYTDQVLDVKYVKEVSARAIERIYSSSHLRYSSTAVLVNYAIAWATEQCRASNQPATTENMRGFLKSIADYVPLMLVKSSTPDELNTLFSGLITKNVKYPLTHKPAKKYTVQLPQTAHTSTGHQIFFNLDGCAIYSIEFTKAIRVQSVVFIKKYNYESPDRIVHFDSEHDKKTLNFFPPYVTDYDVVGIYILHSKYDKSTDELYHVQRVKCNNCKHQDEKHTDKCYLKYHKNRVIELEKKVKSLREYDKLFEERPESYDISESSSFGNILKRPPVLYLYLASIKATIVFTRCSRY